MKDYIYTTITTADGITRYYETFMNPDGIWSDGRVDYRVKTVEVSREYWETAKALQEIERDEG